MVIGGQGHTLPYMGGSPPGHDMPRVLAQEVLDLCVSEKVFIFKPFSWKSIFLGKFFWGKIFLGEFFVFKEDIGMV